MVEVIVSMSTPPVICMFSFVACAFGRSQSICVVATAATPVTAHNQFIYLVLKLLTFMMKFLSLFVALFLKGRFFG